MWRFGWRIAAPRLRIAPTEGPIVAANDHFSERAFGYVVVIVRPLEFDVHGSNMGRIDTRAPGGSIVSARARQRVAPPARQSNLNQTLNHNVLSGSPDWNRSLSRVEMVTGSIQPSFPISHTEHASE
jgi:hypothetical protein